MGSIRTLVKEVNSTSVFVLIDKYTSSNLTEGWTFIVELQKYVLDLRQGDKNHH